MKRNWETNIMSKKQKIEETFYLADSFDEEIIDERAQTIESCKAEEIELKLYQNFKKKWQNTKWNNFKHSGAKDSVNKMPSN